MALRFDILTTFPEMFDPDSPAALGLSIPARARAAGLVEWHAHDIRAHMLDPQASSATHRCRGPHVAALAPLPPIRSERSF